MRINKYIALSTGLSRRAADTALQQGRVMVNGERPETGQQVEASDHITLDNQPLELPSQTTTIMLNKPVGYICSRDGQGGKTIYELLPENLHHLKPVGRLDKDSSGLLIMTDNGELAYELTHPKFQKTKVYEVAIDQPLSSKHFKQITGKGVDIGDKTPSQLQLKKLIPNSYFQVTIKEGRNRQIRRTFDALGYKVTKLHRITFGPYRLDSLAAKAWKTV